MNRNILSLAAGLVLAATLFTSCSSGSGNNPPFHEQADTTVTTPPPAPVVEKKALDTTYTVTPQFVGASVITEEDYTDNDYAGCSRKLKFKKQQFTVHFKIDSSKNENLPAVVDVMDAFENHGEGTTDTNKVVRINRAEFKTMREMYQTIDPGKLSIKVRHKVSLTGEITDKVFEISLKATPEKWEGKTVIEAVPEKVLWTGTNY